MSSIAGNEQKLLYENKYKKIENKVDNKYASSPLIINYNQNDTKNLVYNFKYDSNLDANKLIKENDLNKKASSTSKNNNSYKYNTDLIQNKENVSNNINNNVDHINSNITKSPTYKNIYKKNIDYNELLHNNHSYYFNYSNYEPNIKNYGKNKMYSSDFTNNYNQNNLIKKENESKNINEKSVPQFQYIANFTTPTSSPEKIKANLKKKLAEREKTYKNLYGNINNYPSKNLNYNHQKHKTDFYSSNYFDNFSQDVSINSTNLKNLNDEQEKISEKIEEESLKLKLLEDEKNKLVLEEKERREKILSIINQQNEKEIINRTKFEKSFQKKLEDEKKLKQIKQQQLQKMKEIDELKNKKQMDEKKYSLLVHKKNNSTFDQNIDKFINLKYSMTSKDFYNPSNYTINNNIDNYTGYNYRFSLSSNNTNSITNTRFGNIITPYPIKNSIYNENSQLSYNNKKIRKHNSTKLSKRSSFNYKNLYSHSKLNHKSKNCNEESKINKENNKFKISDFYNVNSRNKKSKKNENVKKQKIFNSYKQLPFSISKENEKTKEKINNQKSFLYPYFRK